MALLALMLPVLVACGKKQPDRGSASPSKVSWRFRDFVDSPRNQVGLLTAGSQVAIIDASGHVSAPVTTAAGKIDAWGNGNFVTVSDGSSLFAIDQSGRLAWKRNVGDVNAVVGASSVANANGKNCVVIEATTGKDIYSAACASRRVYYVADDGYMFASGTELWFVDEKTGTERWRQKIEGGEGLAVSRNASGFLAVFPDRRFVEIGSQSGKGSAEGTCAGSASPEHKPGLALPCAGDPEYDPNSEAAHLIARTQSAGDYYLFFNNGSAKAIIARDAVGRVRWKSQWPVPLAMNPRLLGTTGKAVAFVTEPPDERSLIVFDDSGGQLLFRHPLGQRDRVLSIADGQCWGVVTATNATCLDARSGTARWNVPLSGGSAAVWLRHDGGALIADGSPIALSRVDVTGHRLWQVELPNAELAFPDKGPGYLTQDGNGWRFSDVLGILDGDVPTVIDLGTGTRTAVKQ